MVQKFSSPHQGLKTQFEERLPTRISCRTADRFQSMLWWVALTAAPKPSSLMQKQCLTACQGQGELSQTSSILPFSYDLSYWR